MDTKNDYALFIKSMRKHTDNYSFVKASARHLYERCKERSIDWLDVINMIKYVLDKKLCLMLYDVCVSIEHRNFKYVIEYKNILLVIGITDTHVCFRTVLNKDLDQKISVGERIIIKSKSE